jgi:heme exporter protein C
MTAAPKMAATMLTAMLLMTLGFWMYSIAVTLARLRCVIVERESLLSWGKQASMQEVAEAR